MPTTQISLASGETMAAYVAYPKNPDAPAPVVVVIQEIFGVNEGIRGKCEWLASEGFIAVAPDLFFRLEPGVELTDKTQEEWNKAFDLMNRFDIDQGVEDLQEVITQFRKADGANGYVGAMGYCLGGKVAYLMAARSDSDATVGYYGVGLEGLLDESKNIEKPLLLHIAGKDKFVPPEAQAQIIEGLANNHNTALHVYKEQDHAFTRVGGDHYDEAAAKEADHHTILFFKKNLHEPHFVKKAS